MTYTEAIDLLRKRTEQRQEIHAAIDAIEAHVDYIERRYADKEAVRLGHILRHALTPEQYYAAEQAAKAEHPEAWAGRYFKTEGAA